MIVIKLELYSYKCIVQYLLLFGVFLKSDDDDDDGGGKAAGRLGPCATF